MWCLAGSGRIGVAVLFLVEDTRHQFDCTTAIVSHGSSIRPLARRRRRRGVAEQVPVARSCPLNGCWLADDCAGKEQVVVREDACAIKPPFAGIIATSICG